MALGQKRKVDSAAVPVFKASAAGVTPAFKSAQPAAKKAKSGKICQGFINGRCRWGAECWDVHQEGASAPSYGGAAKKAAVSPAAGGAGGVAKSGAVAKFLQAQAAGTSFVDERKPVAQKWTKPQGGKGGVKGKRKPATEFQRVFLEYPTEITEEEAEGVQALREELSIVVEGDGSEVIAPITTFEELAHLIPDYATKSLAEHGITSPMPIQAQALPYVLAGYDVIGIAKTGSGKTLAYLLPALVQIEAQEPIEVTGQFGTPIALVLAPTRELAVQISDEAQKAIAYSQQDGGSNHPEGLGSTSIYGGGKDNKGWQIEALQAGVHIVAATPGRLVDLMEEGYVNMDRVTYFVLDEADRMLEEGFGTQVNHIASHIRVDRQTLFFSATWPVEVQQYAGKMCGSESLVRVSVGQASEGDGPATRDDIVQEVVVFDDESWEERDFNKQQLLYAHLREVCSAEEHKCLVFVSRKTLADELCKNLWAEGFSTNTMHGGKTQDSRLKTLEEFRDGTCKLLVCTDVMGRGLDIPGISHVVVYDMGEVEDYVHRIGRTARGPYGQGHALTFFEYAPKYPDIAAQLVQVLEKSAQEVPDDLRKLAKEVASGKRQREESHKKKWGGGGGGGSWGAGGGDWGGGSEAAMWNQMAAMMGFW